MIYAICVAVGFVAGAFGWCCFDEYRLRSRYRKRLTPILMEKADENGIVTLPVEGGKELKLKMW